MYGDRVNLFLGRATLKYGVRVTVERPRSGNTAENSRNVLNVNVAPEQKTTRHNPRDGASNSNSSSNSKQALPHPPLTVAPHERTVPNAGVCVGVLRDPSFRVPDRCLCRAAILVLQPSQGGCSQPSPEPYRYLFPD